MERSVRELGIRAFILSPFKQKMLPSDARLGRVYGKCEELGVPIMLHTGINWWRKVDYEIGHPRHVDEVAVAYPKLKILAVHCAWPWVMDMMMVAWRHPHVYVDISSHRPKHFTIPGAGWEPLLQYGGRMLADKVIFASTWTLLGMSISALVDEVRSLPLKDGVADKWLGRNAARFFDLG
jgi:predicted TIM-barrel fold metal-dependent hydrolase